MRIRWWALVPMLVACGETSPWEENLGSAPTWGNTRGELRGTFPEVGEVDTFTNRALVYYDEGFGSGYELHVLDEGGWTLLSFTLPEDADIEGTDVTTSGRVCAGSDELVCTFEEQIATLRVEAEQEVIEGNDETILRVDGAFSFGTVRGRIWDRFFPEFRR